MFRYRAGRHEQTWQPSLALQLRRGDATAQEQAAKLLVDAKADINARLQVARILGEVPGPAALNALLAVCVNDKDKTPLRMAAASSLAAYNGSQDLSTSHRQLVEVAGRLKVQRRCHARGQTKAAPSVAGCA